MLKCFLLFYLWNFYADLPHISNTIYFMLHCAFLFFQAKFSFRLEIFSTLHANPVLLKGQLTALRGRLLPLGGSMYAPSSLGLILAFPILVCNISRRDLYICRASQTQTVWALPLISAKICEKKSLQTYFS